MTKTPIHITDVRCASTEEWDSVWHTCPSATFFHSRLWAEAWASYTQGDVWPAPRLITFADGCEALLPLSAQAALKGSATIYLSSPGGTYGGWISKHSLTTGHAKLLWSYIKAACPTLVCRVNPYDEHFVRIIPSDGSDVTFDETHALDLRVDVEVLRRRMQPAQIPRKVRRAEEWGLRLRRLEREHLTTYYDIYIESRRLWQRSTNDYPLALFRHLWSTPFCDFWGVYTNEGALVCGGPILTSRNHVVSWLTLTRTAALSTHASTFFYFQLINHYKAKGYTWFDFNPSGGHEGVRAYKRSFGATPLPSVVFRQESLAVRCLGHLTTMARGLTAVTAGTRVLHS